MKGFIVRWRNCSLKYKKVKIGKVKSGKTKNENKYFNTLFFTHQISFIKMKILGVALFAVLIFISCSDKDPVINLPCYPQNLQQGLVLAYSFENGSLKNETNTDADLTNIGGAQMASDRGGNPQCSYEFNSITGDQYLVRENQTFLNDLDAFSISLWYQPMDNSISWALIEVLLGRNSLDTHCPDRRGEWSLGLYDLRRTVFGHNNSVWAAPADGLNVWYHAVAVYDQNTYQIYLNGELASSAIGIGDCPSGYLAQDIGDMFLGRFFTGRLDDVLFYKRALTATEVAELNDLEPCCGD